MVRGFILGMRWLLKGKLRGAPPFLLASKGESIYKRRKNEYYTHQYQRINAGSASAGQTVVDGLVFNMHISDLLKGDTVRIRLPDYLRTNLASVCYFIAEAEPVLFAIQLVSRRRS